MLTACAAQYPLNTGIETTDNRDIHYTSPSRNDDSDLVLILAFSGGGTRAASLAYGTLEALKQVELQNKCIFRKQKSNQEPC
jgi:NTE family protein